MSDTITQTELKECIEGMGKAFEEFKSTNDAKMQELEKKNSVDPLVEEKLKKIEATMDKWEDVNQKATKIHLEQKQVADKVSNLETMMKRPNSGLSNPEIDQKALAYESI